MLRFLFLCFLFCLFPLTLTAQSYEGDLFDTHTHLEQDELAHSLASRMSSHNVEGAISFMDVAFTDDSENGTIEDIRDITNEHPNTFVPFFNCDCEKSSSQLTTSAIQTVVDDGSDLLSGFGELALYDSPWSDENLAPNQEPFVSVYPILTEANMWVMFHPTTSQEAAIDEVLTNFPDQKFLFHGYAAKDYISNILTNHSNAYLTIDTAALLTRAGDNEGNTLLYASDINSAEDFLLVYEAESDDLMALALANYQDIIQTHPDQVFWGTDASMDWHMEEEVYEKLIEFSRSFIGQLDSSVQEKYAFSNADTLFTPVGTTTGSEEGDGEGNESSASGCQLNSARHSQKVWMIYLLFFPFYLGLKFLAKSYRAKSW